MRNPAGALRVTQGLAAAAAVLVIAVAFLLQLVLAPGTPAPWVILGAATLAWGIAAVAVARFPRGGAAYELVLSVLSLVGAFTGHRDPMSPTNLLLAATFLAAGIAAACVLAPHLARMRRRAEHGA